MSRRTGDGHAIEVRLYAEDPEAGFLPATGDLVAFEPVAGDGVRWDAGVEAGSMVGVEFDPMLAKVIAHAPTRTEAARLGSRSGEAPHRRGHHQPRFPGGHVASWMLFSPAIRPRTSSSGSVRVPLEHDVQEAAIVGALWLQGRNRAEASTLSTLPTGWRNTRLPFQQVRLSRAGTTIDVRYQARRGRRLRAGRRPGGEGPKMVRDGAPCRNRWTPNGAPHHLCRHGPVRAGRHRDRRASSCATFELSAARGPMGGLVAPMPGVVVDVRCAVGDRVAAGQPLVVLEAMKMEHHMAAPDDGIVAELHVEAGQQVKNGAAVARARSPTRTRRPSDRTGTHRELFRLLR